MLKQLRRLFLFFAVCWIPVLFSVIVLAEAPYPEIPTAVNLSAEAHITGMIVRWDAAEDVQI